MFKLLSKYCQSWQQRPCRGQPSELLGCPDLEWCHPHCLQMLKTLDKASTCRHIARIHPELGQGDGANITY